jgi:L,D-transpeptidase ErfK/SrfK
MGGFFDRWHVAMSVALVLAGIGPVVSQTPGALIAGGVVDYEVAPGDTMTRIGSRFGVAVATLARDNGIDTARPLRPGPRLRIDHRHIVPGLPLGTIVVNVPQRMLFFEDHEGRLAYPVAAGRPDWPTPIGEFEVLTVEPNPTWDVPESIREEARRAGRTLPLRVPPGPANPLGAFWLGLSIPNVGIHGTNAPDSIYGLVTHGCLRLHPDNIGRLAQRVGAGVRGRIVYEPVLVAVLDAAVYVEVHADAYRSRRSAPLDVVRRRVVELSAGERVDWVKVANAIEAQDGIARDVTLASSR